jgi:hypothetical protein
MQIIIVEFARIKDLVDQALANMDATVRLIFPLISNPFEDPLVTRWLVASCVLELVEDATFLERHGSDVEAGKITSLITLLNEIRVDDFVDLRFDELRLNPYAAQYLSAVVTTLQMLESPAPVQTSFPDRDGTAPSAE